MEELICNECKGRKYRKISASEYECEYCGAVIKEAVEQAAPQVVIVQQQTQEPQPKAIVSPFPPEVSYTGSRNDSMTRGTTGRLVIYPDKFAFIADTSNIFNRGNLSNQEWNIINIAGYTKGAINMLDIKYKNGDIVNFSFTNRDQIIRLLEERRKFWAKEGKDGTDSEEELKVKSTAGRSITSFLFVFLGLLCIFGWFSIIKSCS